MDGKPPTAQGVSALLRKAGFERSVSSATRIRGWHDRSSGFMVTGYGGEVTVTYVSSLFRRADQGHIVAALNTYAEAIRAKGWEVAGPDGMNQLTVTAKTEGES